MARGYGPVLSNRRFLILWLAQAGSDLGDVFTRMALLIFVTEKTTSPVALSVVIAVQMVPMILFAPFVGVLVDRWDKKRVMVTSDVLRAILLLGVASSTQLWQVFVLSFLVSLVSQFFMPARATTIPEVVGREHYLSAVALSQMTLQFMQLLGPAVGGALTGLLGTKAAFLVNVATFTLSAILITTVRFPALPKKDEPVTLRAFVVDFREGLTFLGSTRALRYLVSVFAGVVVGFGFFDVLYIDYTRNVLGTTPAQFGFLQSVFALGSILGVAVVGQLGAGLSKARSILGGIGAAGVISALFFFHPGFALVAAGGVLFGLCLAFVNVPVNTLFAVLTPVEKRGRVNGVVNSAVNVSSLLGLAAAGPLAKAIGSGMALGFVGIFVAVTAVVARLLPDYAEIDRADAEVRRAGTTVPAEETALTSSE